MIIIIILYWIRQKNFLSSRIWWFQVYYSLPAAGFEADGARVLRSLHCGHEDDPSVASAVVECLRWCAWRWWWWWRCRWWWWLCWSCLVAATATEDDFLCRKDRIFRLHRLSRPGDEESEDPSESAPPPPVVVQDAWTAGDESDESLLFPALLLLLPELLLPLLLDQKPIVVRR